MEFEHTAGTFISPAGILLPDASVATRDPARPTEASPARRNPKYIRNAGISFATLLLAFGLASKPDLCCRPITRFLNQWAHRSITLDTAIWSLDACFLFSGVVLTALLWFCWFG